MYERNLRAAKRVLRNIPAFCGDDAQDKTLSGWVYEKTVQYCLRRELRAAGLELSISEQVSLLKRSRFDLQVGKVLVEVKKSGLYNKDSLKRYRDYRRLAKSHGLHYLYLSGEEAHKPYRVGAAAVFGAKNIFILDRNAEWSRFVRRLIFLSRH
jgi:hypothetical protein